MKYFALILAISLTPLAHASNHGDYEPEALIKYRQDMMTAIRGHNNAIKAIVNGKVPYDNQLGMHIESLKDLFSQIDNLFPEGSDFGETSAKDEVWDKPDKFREAVDRANQALAKFERAIRVGNKSADRSAFKEFGKASCGNCHKSFKKKDD
jgi:cytochrome c556